MGGSRVLRRRFAAPVGAIIGVFAIALVWVPAPSSATSGVEPSPLCNDFPPPSSVAATAWLSNANGQAASNALDAVLARYGSTVLGAVPDHGPKVVHVVVDSAASDDLVTQIATDAAGSENAFTVVTDRSCHTRQALDAVRSSLVARNWSAAANQVTFSAFIDAAAGRVDLILDGSNQSAAAAAAADAQASFGDLVQVTTGTVAPSDRFNDASPHYGGSAISPDGSSVSATSGFAISGFLGVRFYVVAGHSLAAAPNHHWHSGSFGFGQDGGTAPDFPTHDLGLVYATNVDGTYTNVLHVDPCCPSLRTVTGSQEPTLNSSICASGAVSLANCQGSVNTADHSVTVCEAGLSGCTSDLDAATTPGGVAVQCQAGDSGAPFYYRSGSTAAKVAGIQAAVGTGFGYNFCFFHPVSVVMSVYAGSSVLTTP